MKQQLEQMLGQEVSVYFESEHFGIGVAGILREGDSPEEYDVKDRETDQLQSTFKVPGVRSIENYGRGERHITLKIGG